MSEQRVFGPRADAIGSIRGYVQQALLRHGVSDESIDAAVLCTSELATDALLHGEGVIGIDLDIHQDRARVVVRDHDTRPTVLRQPALEDDAGRGLLLVSLLTDLWGVEAYDDGKAVWFEIDLRQRPAEDTASGSAERRRWGQRASSQA